VSYTVFARKYRPQTFDEIVGQQHIVRTLKNALDQNRLAQAYLFVGPRGTGKTTTARILAKALNCRGGPKADFDPNEDVCLEIAEGRSMNVLEFDAASNTQVDKIREIIIDNVKYAPTGDAKYKVYIVDEVHMLSTSSFNALLKTLEEPPAHVKFVFATTDVQKVPTTIISRCQRFDLTRIPTAEIAQHLLYIAGEEKIALSAAAAETIARGAEGGLRDAESMLDQLVAFCGETIEEADVLNIFGFTSAQTVATLCEHLLSGETAPALSLIHQQCEGGKDLSRLMGDLIAHLRNLLVIQSDPEAIREEFSREMMTVLTEQSGRIAVEKLLDLIDQFAGAESRMKWAPNKKMHFEIAAIRAIQTLKQATLTEVLETLTALRGGEPLPEKKAAPPARTAPPKSAAPAAPKPSATELPPDAAPRQSLSQAVSATLELAKAAVSSALTPPPIPAGSVAAPSAPPPAARPTPKDDLPAIDLGQIWTQLVGRVRQDRPLIQGWVEAGKLVEIARETAVLAFPPGADLARESCERANNRKYLEATLTELVGQPLSIECVKREGLVIEDVARIERKTEPPPDPLLAFKDDPLIQKALADFRAEIIPT
jgi:DNA polymerase-3 subunit gamma/tau